MQGSEVVTEKKAVNVSDLCNMIEEQIKTYHFLEGGGEMGRLTREFNWSATTLGPVSAWPQSLRTIVDVILHSEVPMLLWWGDDLIQFYNDAYRPSLGENGKHPVALGQPGAECWPETWTFIKPLIDQVREGGATWHVDQLVPIYRNGKWKMCTGLSATALFVMRSDQLRVCWSSVMKPRKL